MKRSALDRRIRVGAAALLALGLVFAVGVGSGRSLAHVGGPGPIASPSSYLRDLGVVALAAFLAVAGTITYAVFSGGSRRRRKKAEQVLEQPPVPWWAKAISVLVPLVAIGGIAYAAALLAGSANESTTTRLPVAPQPGVRPTTTVAAHPSFAPVHWSILGGLALLVLVGGVIAWQLSRRRRQAFEPVSVTEADAISEAVGLSLEEIERERDPRRAVIKAYARMEQALAENDLDRRPAETPFEYLARTLVMLSVSRASAQRLTSLFAHAKFSQHEVDQVMKQDALSALTAVRDELEART